ncbi:MAG TPA: enoyl-CoA hydratase-related protein [Streptosporangiaceae bacterium]|jgi:methionyl-tRNA formyltransferase
MRILLLASAYNSMAQRVHAELADRGHEVAVELALGDEVMREAVRRCDPRLVIAPMLTTAIPADIWSSWPCFIVHPGPVGDRGPSSLDWAVMAGASRWGVTVLQANAEMDAGDIWASVEFAVPACSKSSLYRTEVADAALQAVLLAVARFESGTYRPEPLDYHGPGVFGRLRPPCRQPDRRIDWAAEPTASVLAKLRAADSRPGVLDVLGGAEYFLVGGHAEDHLRGEPGAVIARRDGALCRATVDGAVWIPQLRRRPAAGGPAAFKLPATKALGEAAARVPHVPAPLTPPPGRTAAGGFMLALAADQVWCRDGAVLNPHNRLMGLHGSEYWTYTLPRRVGSWQADRLTQACLPVSPAAALRCGLIDKVIGGGAAGFRTQVATLAAQLAASPDYPARLAAKARELAAAEDKQPLAAYRAIELAVMRWNFTGLGEAYPHLRRAFVYQEKPARTPPHLACHQAGSGRSGAGQQVELEPAGALAG